MPQAQKRRKRRKRRRGGDTYILNKPKGICPAG
jgi:hypothetical protein